MARVYVITEVEMQSLMDQLELQAMSDRNVLIHPDRLKVLSDEAKMGLGDVHRAFHFVCVRWAQDMGFKGHRS